MALLVAAQPLSFVSMANVALARYGCIPGWPRAFVFPPLASPVLFLISMDRIADAFQRARDEGRACFIAYLCAGDPDFDTSLACCRTLIENGVDLLELGVPFSDPLADGLTNQLAAQRALEGGMIAGRVFELAREIRKFSEVPLVFYTYYNLAFANGLRDYVHKVHEAGVDGMLTLDLPPEEADEMLEYCREAGVQNIFIVAPTTPERRIQTIARAATGFVYYVSREGVTGVRDQLADNIADAVTGIKQSIDLPVAVGFGISTRDQVRQVGAMADGVIVGSALVNCIRDNLGNRSAIVEALGAKAKDLVAGLRGTAPAR